jgi:hypothetical protein
MKEMQKEEARQAMTMLVKCANTLDTQSNLELVERFRTFDRLQAWRALGFRTARACVEHAIQERSISVTMGTLLSYWRVAKAADKYDVSTAMLRQIGFSRAKMIFTAPADHIADLLAVGSTMSASDLEERVKMTRGIRNRSSLTFTGLLPGDLRETEALLAHARSIVPDLSNGAFYRLLMATYRSHSNVHQQIAA